MGNQAHRGWRRLRNAAGYSWAGLQAAWRHEEAFRQEYETLQHQLEQLQELAADGHNEQSSVLWQQLVMMANLLKPSRQAIQTAEAQA